MLAKQRIARFDAADPGSHSGDGRGPRVVYCKLTFMFTLGEIVPQGHLFDEYRWLSALSICDLRWRILGHGRFQKTSRRRREQPLRNFLKGGEVRNVRQSACFREYGMVGQMRREAAVVGAQVGARQAKG